MLNDAAGVVKWTAVHSIHPPGWRLAIDAWVDLFGHHENITRFLSTLYTLLTLALTYRLAADLFDERAGLLAVFVLGTLPLFIFHSHEVRPYSALVTGAVGAQWAFMRWLRRPGFLYALLFILFGIGLVYTHFYGLFLIAALALYVVLFVRFRASLYLRAFALLAAVGLSFTAWLLPLWQMIANRPKGIGYSLSSERLDHTLFILSNDMLTSSGGLGVFLLLVGAVARVQRRLIRAHEAYRFRFAASWEKIYAAAIPLLILGLALVSNAFIRNLTPRNLILILPSTAIVIALGLLAVNRLSRCVLVGMIILGAVTTFRVYVITSPGREMVEFLLPRYQPGDVIITDQASPPQHLVLLYYLHERSSFDTARMFHLMNDSREYIPAMPRIPDQMATSADPEALDQFETLIDSTQKVWYLESEEGVGFGSFFLDHLYEQFSTVARTRFGPHEYPTRGYESFWVTELRRIPELKEIFHFGDKLTLRAWSLLHSVDVQPCQAVTLESWWTAGVPLPDNYSLSLALANSGGIGVANTDSEPAGVLTQQWQPGRVYLDERSVAVPCDAAPGEYPLLLGLYDPDTLTALPAALPDGTPLGDQAYLTTLLVR